MHAKTAGNEWFLALHPQQLFANASGAQAFASVLFARMRDGDKSCPHGMTIWLPRFLAFETKRARACVPTGINRC
jgi:hypothetical protein